MEYLIQDINTLSIEDRSYISLPSPGMEINSLPTTLSVLSISQRIMYLKYYLDNIIQINGNYYMWKSVTGISNYRFITNPLLRKLVEYWNQEVDVAMENYREAELAVQKEGSFNTNQEPVYEIWVRVWNSDDHLITKKMWVSGDNVKEVLGILARTETTNIRGEVAWEY